MMLRNFGMMAAGCILMGALLVQNMAAQNAYKALGTWQVHLPYRAASSLALAPNKLFVGTSTSLFSYDLDDNSLQTYSKIDGFAELEVAKMAYNDTHGLLFIAYENANIDLFINDARVVNKSDIRRSTIPGEKKINHIRFDGDLAYLSCSFGITVFDLASEDFEVRDTYIIGPDGETLTVWQTAANGTQIMAATENGLFQADLSNPNLSNFNNWHLVDELPTGEVSNVVWQNNTFYASVQNVLYRLMPDGDWLPVYANPLWEFKSVEAQGDKLLICEWEVQNDGDVTANRITNVKENNEVSHIANWQIFRPVAALFDDNGRFYAADLWKTLIQVKGDGSSERLLPNGPYSADVWDLAVKDGDVWVASGGTSNSLNGIGNIDGYYWMHNGNWEYFSTRSESLLNGFTDFVSVQPHPNANVVYAASFAQGLVEYDYEEVAIYNAGNSPLASPVNNPGVIRVYGLAFDRNNNLWMNNYGAPATIVAKKPDGEWQAFTPSVTINENGLYNLLVDDADQKWMIAKRQGLVVFNHGADLTDVSDDQYKRLQKGAGRGNLPVNEVNCIVKDRDGAIWVGTNEGVAVFYCPYDVFFNGCEAVRPYVEVDGIGANLLETESVREITVDAANRKWIGTENGLWLMSEDGTEAIQYFTKENSPLLSNVINAVAIDEATGEVYIGTSKGLVSYRGDATAGGATHGEVLVYPNPVRPEYEGPIAIKGLAENAYVKITDVSGTLIYETRAQGGQAVWDGKDYTGRRASTGVYLVLSTNFDGSDSVVSKFLVVN